MSHPVLIAIDLAAASEQALSQGLAVARRAGAQVVVCHVIPDVVRVRALFPQLGADDSFDALTLGTRIRELVCSWLEERGATQDVVTVRIETGQAPAQIIDVAEAIGASVVVLKSAPRSDDGLTSVGRTAEQVLRNAKTPVLIARASPAKGPILVCRPEKST